MTPPLAAALAATILLAGCEPPLERSPPPPQWVPEISDAELCEIGPRYVADPWVRDFERVALARRMAASGCPPV
jgi:hypothetical protein